MYQEKKMNPEDILTLIKDGDDIIIPLANGEPEVLLDTIEAHATRWKNVKIHQMHPRKARPYIHGAFPGHLRHVAYFLSGASRKAFLEGKCDLVPNNFHEVPRILRERTSHNLVMAVSSPMDEHGYFSLGTNADYTASFIGKAPFVLEVNRQMPRTFGNNQIHISQVEGFIEVDYPNFEVETHPPGDIDRNIASYVAELIPDGSTLQVGIGGVPNAIISFLNDKKHLGIHTELLTDGIVDLVESGVIDGLMKKTNPGKIVGTFAMGTKKLYDFIDQNPGVMMMPVDHVNDPRVIGQEEKMISINSTTEIDFYGQCASETIQGRYYSSSGGQADFARGAAFSPYGRGFICLHSTTRDGSISRIKPQLSPGSAVTTSKNDVHYVVTEYGAVNLKGKSIYERARLLISIAHPNFRDELTFKAKQLGLLI
ncbi:MAG: propionyl-CoA--succinate CoA transferase [Bacillaceae bacterium]|nr:propionyl-CoA--succinate CoA transferase [Bacillaceae bacterium]